MVFLVLDRGGLFMLKRSTKILARTGIVSAVYAVLSLIVFPVASGSIQFRLSEALCILPLLFPETVISLFVGCLISNAITGCAVYDVVFGSLISLLSAALTSVVGKFIKGEKISFFVGGSFSVLLNAFLLPLVWFFCYGKLEYLYLVQVAFLLISQTVSVYVLGYGLFYGLSKLKKKGVPFLK